MSELLNRLQAYFIPSGLNIVERTRAKVLLWILVVIFFFSILMYPLTFIIYSSFPFVYLFFGACILLAILKLTSSVTLVGNLTVCLTFISIAFTSFQSGGIYSHDLAGLFLVLVCSVSLLEVKYTYLYSILIIAFTYYMYYRSGDPEQLELFRQQRQQYSRGYYFVICTMFSVLPLLFLSIISRLNSRLIENLRSTNSKLDETNTKLDLEKEKLIEAKSELEKSNLKLERYAHTASHDLQQPIRTIISFTQLLSKQVEKLDLRDQKLDDYLDQVVSGTKRMDAQVQDLLSFSQVSNKEKSHVNDLREIVNNVLKDLNNMIVNSEATIKVGDLPKVNVIKSNLSQVFQNLISNAIKYRKPDNPIHIDIKSIEENNEWIIRVSDNGRGIEKQDIHKIFRLYSQVYKKNDGLGIGLATCQQIIESYGGQIWVESEPGKGSDFFFTLPKIIAEA